MKRINSVHALIAALAIVLVGFYAVDVKPSKTASVFSLPNFTTTTDVPPADEKPVKTLEDINDALVNVANETKQTVVTIRVTQTVKMQPSPLTRFFGNPMEAPREYQQRGLGSGVIVSSDGYILTNDHVIQDADEIIVTLIGGKEYEGEIIGTDPQTDIAVIKIDAESLPAIELGNSDKVRVGELVLAIGSPLGENLAHSVSMGIISAKERSIQILADVAGYENFIQTDAAINPGNSGGALVNMDGELIGINSAIASRSGGNDGIGFAVPVNLAKSVMQSIIENGRVVRGYLGVSWGGDVDATMARALGLEKTYGVIVGQVTEGGPADEAGLQEGDVIQTINGEPIESWYRFRTAIATSAPGTEVTLGINRDGKPRTVTVELGELPTEGIASNQSPDTSMDENLGFQIDNLTPNLARELGLQPGQSGVVVTNINRGSEAFQQGLRQGAVITSVNRQDIQNVADFTRVMRSAIQQGEDVVLLEVIFQGVNQFIAFEL